MGGRYSSLPTEYASCKYKLINAKFLEAVLSEPPLEVLLGAIFQFRQLLVHLLLILLLVRLLPLHLLHPVRLLRLYLWEELNSLPRDLGQSSQS